MRPGPLLAPTVLLFAWAMPTLCPAAEPNLVGAWTVKYRDNNGRELIETVEFTADGRFTISIRDAAGQVLVERSGTYTLAEGRLRLTASGMTTEGALAMVGADRFTFALGAFTTVYDRVRAVGTTPANPAVGGRTGATGKPLPEGFESRRAEGGTGEVLVVRRAEARSAKRVLADALKSLSGYFDEKPSLPAGGIVLDKTDTSIQAMFLAKVGGRPVVGAALASVADGEGFVFVLYDQAGKPLAPLFALAEQGGAAATVSIRRQNVQLPDGSGTMSLPEGWRIESAYKGAVVASGPHGRVELGIGLPVTTIEADRAAAAQFAQLGVPYARPALVASDRDPVTTLQQLIPQLSAVSEKGGGARTTLTKIIEQHAVPWQNGRAAVVCADLETATREARASVRAAALIAVMPIGSGQFLYYYSAVSAPADKFQAHLPILLDVWRSWRVADWVHTERMLSAMKSLREAHDLYRQAHANYQKTSDRVWRAWGEYNRGVHAVLDTGRNQVGTVQLSWVDDAVKLLNQQAGYERFRKVTPFELDY